MADPISAGALAFSTILSAGGQISQGISANNAARWNATQEELAGQQQFAASQRRAYQETRKGNLTLSRARAVAAASGASATDPTVATLEGDIAAQGEYNAMTSLYEGEEAQRTGKIRGALDRFEGKQYQKAGFIKGATTLLSGGAGLYDKYGGGGFDTGGGDSFASTGYSDLPRYG